MATSESIRLRRDCEAVQIPSGTATVIPEGTEVHVAQSLGGTYTVHAPGGLYRIASGDADALGLEATPEGGAPGEGPLTETQVWEVLRSCYDPEIPVNIVDLGLVYDMHLDPLASGGSKVCVKMTLTAPGCGMGGVIAADAQQKLLQLPGVEEAEVELVWDPPWHQSMISAAGRAILGLE